MAVGERAPSRQQKAGDEQQHGQPEAERLEQRGRERQREEHAAALQHRLAVRQNALRAVSRLRTSWIRMRGQPGADQAQPKRERSPAQDPKHQ